MIRERIFSSRGSLPKKGLHPVVSGLLLAYLLLVIYLLSTSDLRNVRFTGPGIIPILLMSRAMKNKEEPISVFLDLVEGDELCVGYTKEGKTDQKEYFVDEYSYWCYPNRRDPNFVDLVFKVKTVRNEIVYLVETNATLSNPSNWESLNQEPSSGEINIHVQDLEGLSIQMDRNSI